MEVVLAFKNELSSLYEAKPPISKAKMTQITKCAIKGLKYYKHIVQSVEKFIQKCRPEYKVPGLYVVDSIVRQSRHQFGADKDVFAPRFTKNIRQTFMHLFKCPDEDKSKIVRVLNLWQKNSVFPSDVIQPLLDMANPNSSGEWSFEQPVLNDSPVRKATSQTPLTDILMQNKCKPEISSWKGWPQSGEETAEDNHGLSEVSSRNLEKFAKVNSTTSSNLDSSQLPMAQGLKAEISAEENTVKFNKKLLDFDYGDEDEEEEMKTDDIQLPGAPNPLALSMAQNLLSNPELLRQLQQMQQTIQQSEALKSELALQPQIPMEEVHREYSPEPPETVPMPAQPQEVPSTRFQPYELMPPQNINAIPYPEQRPPDIMAYQFNSIPPPFTIPQQQIPIPEPVEAQYPHPVITSEQILMQSSQVDEDDRVIYSMPGEPPLPPQDLDERAIVIPALDDHVRKERSRSRSDSRSRTRSGRHRSRSRSPHRRRSRSGSRSRSKRNRSRSKERDRQREKRREQDRDKEKRKKGIPNIKKNHMTVCSTTLWMGHVPRICSEIDVSATLEEFGTILSIDMIPPRGCAYVVMERRQDAYRALQKLKNLKLQGSSIKVAWAPGKGVKGKELKEYWDVESGSSLIPYEKLPNDIDAVDLLEEGGFIDEESMPTHLQEMRQQREKVKQAQAEGAFNKIKDIMMPSVTTVPSTMLPPTSMGLPMMPMPQMMQTQFGIPMPGMMPSQPMVLPMPVGVPPPNPLMMVQPPGQPPILAGTPLPVGAVPQMPHLTLPLPSLPPVSAAGANVTVSSKMEPAKDSASSSIALGDATPTEEDGTSISSPSSTTAIQTVPSLAAVTSMSIPVLGPQFTAGLAHGIARPMLPVLPPVSSAGAPIPFPPPQVGFGFPPPPHLRPGMPNPNIPGMIAMPNSPFPWLPKTSASPFGSYSDSDMRFTPPTSTSLNAMPPLMAQLAGLSAVVTNQESTDSSLSQPAHSSTKDTLSTVSADSQREKEVSEIDAISSDNKQAKNISGLDAFARPDGSFDKSREIRRTNQDDVHGSYGGDADITMIAQFPGPGDYPPRGAMQMPWMQGPNNIPVPGFPRSMLPFSPRGSMPRPMHQPLEMDFFSHQNPAGRMRMQGSQQPRWKNDSFTSQRNYQNRMDFHDVGHFEGADQDRRRHPRDDWGRERGRWEDQERKGETEIKVLTEQTGKYDKSTLEPSIDDNTRKDGKSSTQKDNDKTKPVPPKQPAKKSAPPDFSFDLFRLQSYGKRCASVTKIKGNAEKRKKEQVNKETEIPKQDIASSDEVSSDKTNDNNIVSSEVASNIVSSEGANNIISSEGANNIVSSEVANNIVSTEGANNIVFTEGANNIVSTEGANDAVSNKENEFNANEVVSMEVIEVRGGKTGDTVNEQLKPNDAFDMNVTEAVNASNTPENRSRKDRDKKRSRWGRTLSQEREFQQQKFSELGLNIQNSELSQLTPALEDKSESSLTQVSTADNPNVDNLIMPVSARVDIPTLGILPPNILLPPNGEQLIESDISTLNQSTLCETIFTEQPIQKQPSIVDSSVSSPEVQDNVPLTQVTLAS